MAPQVKQIGRRDVVVCRRWPCIQHHGPPSSFNFSLWLERFAPRRDTQDISCVYFCICVFLLFPSLPAASHCCLSPQRVPCQIVPPPRHAGFQQHQVASSHSWPPLSLGFGLSPISPRRRRCISPSSLADTTPEASIETWVSTFASCTLWQNP